MTINFIPELTHGAIEGLKYTVTAVMQRHATRCAAAVAQLGCNTASLLVLLQRATICSISCLLTVTDEQ